MQKVFNSIYWICYYDIYLIVLCHLRMMILLKEFLFFFFFFVAKKLYLLLKRSLVKNPSTRKRARYYVGNECTTPASSSPIWRSIAQHWPRLLTAARWTIGEGSISFWTANICFNSIYCYNGRIRFQWPRPENDQSYICVCLFNFKK